MNELRVLIVARDQLARAGLAALSVDAEGLPAIEVGESRNLLPGQLMLALGHPLGVPGAAAGVIIDSGGDLHEAPVAGREWIAVGLSLRPGHSGGPLVDAEGRLDGNQYHDGGPGCGYGRAGPCGQGISAAGVGVGGAASLG